MKLVALVDARPRDWRRRTGVRRSWSLQSRSGGGIRDARDSKEPRKLKKFGHRKMIESVRRSTTIGVSEHGRESLTGFNVGFLAMQVKRGFSRGNSRKSSSFSRFGAVGGACKATRDVRGGLNVCDEGSSSRQGAEGQSSSEDAHLENTRISSRTPKAFETTRRRRIQSAEAGSGE